MARRTLLLLPALLALAAPAHAATVSLEQIGVDFDPHGPGTPVLAFRFVAALRETNSATVIQAGQTLSVTDDGAPLVAGSRCTGGGSHVVCTANGRLASGEIYLGDENDRAFARGQLTIHGGSGDDTLLGDGATVDGGPGADRLGGEGSRGLTVSYAERTAPVAVTLDGVANDGEAGEADNVEAGVAEVIGGAASDDLDGSGSTAPLTLRGLTGDDILTGGHGNDTIALGPGNDTVRGGPGFDKALADYTYAPGALGIRMSLDGLANDGVPGAGGNVASDVEEVVGNPGPDVLVGDAGPNTLIGNGGADFLSGGGGDDALDAWGVLDAGSGQDRVIAEGPAEILARDGERDTIACQRPYEVTLHVDAIDDLHNCASPLAVRSTRLRAGRRPSAIRLSCAGAGLHGCAGRIVVFDRRGRRLGRASFSQVITSSQSPRRFQVRLRLRLPRSEPSRFTGLITATAHDTHGDAPTKRYTRTTSARVTIRR